ncbi:MAG: hypothetical protein ACP5RH_19685 [Leptodesmis sp.]|uniref:hypothetical protein n=1 Tax=Leptodesmis sp. TaxID=3100501 RepID=UPI003D137402
MIALPLIAALLWLGGNLIAAQVLSRPYDSVHVLQVDTQLDVKLSVSILAFIVRIDRRRGVTTISVKTTDSTLRKLEYEFPITQASQIEAAIAQELAMPIASVRKLISFKLRIKGCGMRHGEMLPTPLLDACTALCPRKVDDDDGNVGMLTGDRFWRNA